PGRFLTARHVATVLLGHLAISAPEHLAEVHLAGHHDGLAALPRPVERGLQTMGEARVDGNRILQWTRGNPDLADRAIGVDAASVFEIHGMPVRLALPWGREGPVLPLEGEGVLRPRRLDDGHALLE